MLIDLIVVALLIRMGALFLGLVAALVLWRFSGRAGTGGRIKQWSRVLLRAAAAVIAFLVVINAWQRIASVDSDDEQDLDDDVPSANLNFDLNGLDLSPSDGAQLIALAAELGAADSAGARLLADSLAVTLRSAGADSARLLRLRPAALLLSRSNLNPAARAAIDSAFGVPDPDDLMQEQQATIQLLSRQNAQLQGRLQADRTRGIRAWAGAAADDLGLGFGWMALYFTAFLALMRGQTPGKKLLRIRVLRLDAKPISWWIAFERFGGYAASATLGLLGFLQILWDRNRQGLHDKAVETVVIKVTK
ncbi:MAG TPA: RDD family protein [Longimicrobiales bacterium]|nr:RDD family protein [Longimicrobiales bacterium]